MGAIESGDKLLNSPSESPEIPAPLEARRGFTEILVASWLTIRGLLWLTEALFFQEAGLSWHASLVDGLLGIFCISLATQLWLGIAGVWIPILLMLIMHLAIHIHRWAIIDAPGWWAISTSERIQVIFESGVVLLLIHGVILAMISKKADSDPKAIS
ncbi:MAG: hypothetical protein AAEJ04_03360 [Planctomycetota bacterium]